MQTKYKDGFAVHAVHPRPEGRGFPLKLINRDELSKLSHYGASGCPCV